MRQQSHKRSLVILWIVTFCAFLCVGIPLSVLPRYVQGELGGGDVAAGFAVGSLSLAAMLTRPWGGRLADERSRRLVVTAGISLCAIGGGGMVALSGSYAWLIASRMVAGAGESMVYAAAMAWALDLTPVERHGRSISVFGMAIWVGATLGTAAGEGLLQWTGSYAAVWWAVLVVPLVALAMMGLTEREAPRARPAGPRGPLIVREAIRPGAALGLSNVGYGAVAGLVTLHLVDRGVANPGLTLTAVALGVVVTRLAVAAALDRTSPHRIFAIGCVAEAVSLVVLALAASLPVAVLGGLLLGAGYAAVFPALALIAVSDAPSDKRGATLGSFTAFLDFGLAIGGPLAGLAAALLGRPWTFVAFAIVTVTALLAAPRAAPPPANAIVRPAGSG